jgi:hypothetical protein
MSVTITAANGAGSTTPITVLSPYETTRNSRNIVHDLVGGGIAVSLVAPRPRSGTLQLLYDDEVDANAALTLHAEETTFTLSETSVPSVSMQYVVEGDVRLALEDSTLLVWILNVGYQEVSP